MLGVLPSPALRTPSAATLLQAFLAFAADVPDDLAHFVGSEVGESRALCDGAVAGQLCGNLEGALEGIQGTRSRCSKGVGALVGVLTALGDCYLRCKACCHLVGRLVASLAKTIDGNLMEKPVSRNPFKRLRYWCSKEMSAYQVAGYREFQQLPKVFSVCEDGTRLGQPAREVMVYHWLDNRSRRSLVLPNQASRVPISSPDCHRKSTYTNKVAEQLLNFVYICTPS